MNIGTARNMMLSEERQGQYWEIEVERHRKAGSRKKVGMALDFAVAHRDLADMYEEWIEVRKREK